jgi:hypothetical protein
VGQTIYRRRPPFIRSTFWPHLLGYNGKSRLAAAFSYFQSLWGLASSGPTKAYEFKATIVTMKGQSGFLYDDHALITIEKYISSERLIAFRNA